MAGMCDKIKDWDSLTDAEKVDLVQDLVAHMAHDYDVPVPEVVSGVPDFPETPEDDSQKYGAYDKDTNTIYINDQFFGHSDPDQVLEEAGHEFAHELFEENFADADTQPGESEAYADEYTEQMQEEIEDYCENPPPPQSPGQPDDDMGDWNLADSGEAIGYA